MRRDAWNTNCLRVLLEHLPDDLLAQAIAGHPVGSVHWSEDIPVRDTGRAGPGNHARGYDDTLLNNR